MKIQNDPLHALLEQGEAHRKPKVDGEGFEALLNQQLNQSQNGAAAAFAATAEQNSAALAMQIRASQELSGMAGTNEAAQDGDFVFERMNSLLDKWDMYSGSMARPGAANLKQMYGLLEGMSDELQSIKGSAANLDGNPALAGLVNELDVLTTTERFKFDRGDYL